jgi:hypothetical protein
VKSEDYDHIEIFAINTLYFFIIEKFRLTLTLC